jgi:hypothetical protein
MELTYIRGKKRDQLIYNNALFNHSKANLKELSNHYKCRHCDTSITVKNNQIIRNNLDKSPHTYTKCILSDVEISILKKHEEFKGKSSIVIQLI